MEIIIYVVAAILFILVWCMVALKFEAIAFQKGYGKEIHAFAMCFWLGLIGFLYVIALPNLTLLNILTAAQSDQQNNQ